MCFLRGLFVLLCFAGRPLSGPPSPPPLKTSPGVLCSIKHLDQNMYTCAHAARCCSVKAVSDVFLGFSTHTALGSFFRVASSLTHSIHFQSTSDPTTTSHRPFQPPASHTKQPLSIPRLPALRSAHAFLFMTGSVGLTDSSSSIPVATMLTRMLPPAPFSPSPAREAS